MAALKWAQIQDLLELGEATKPRSWLDSNWGRGRLLGKEDGVRATKCLFSNVIALTVCLPYPKMEPVGQPEAPDGDYEGLEASQGEDYWWKVSMNLVKVGQFKGGCNDFWNLLPYKGSY